MPSKGPPKTVDGMDEAVFLCFVVVGGLFGVALVTGGAADLISCGTLGLFFLCQATSKDSSQVATWCGGYVSKICVVPNLV